MGSVLSTVAGGWRKQEVEEQGGGSASPVLVLHTKDAWDAHWESHGRSGKLMVIDFKASWCGPCRFIEPAVKDLASEFPDVVFVKIDVDELPEVSQEWAVQAMPTFVLVMNGKEVGRVVGAKKQELEAMIASNLKI